MTREDAIRFAESNNQLNSTQLHIINELSSELLRASKKHAPINSAHEGYAVILEELDELWDEIKKQKPATDLIYKEALQVAAMALRLIHDVCYKQFPADL